MKTCDQWQAVLDAATDGKVYVADARAMLEELSAAREALIGLFRWGTTHDPNDIAAWQTARANLPTPTQEPKR
jgi:hypothetical protein